MPDVALVPRGRNSAAAGRLQCGGGGRGKPRSVGGCNLRQPGGRTLRTEDHRGGRADDPRNRTRFFILGKVSPAAVSAVPYKTSIVFSVPNTSGSLFKAIEPFSRHGVQMVRLESRPAKNGAWEYNFYVDVEGHPGQSAIDRAIEEVRSRTSVFKILGMYPEARK